MISVGGGATRLELYFDLEVEAVRREDVGVVAKVEESPEEQVDAEDVHQFVSLLSFEELL